MKRTGRLKRRKPIRRISRQAIRDRDLDALCRAVVFHRDGFRCVKCGNTTNLQWAHVYSRRFKSLRWMLGNSMVLCAGCHLAWHHQPLDAITWWIAKYGTRMHIDLLHTLKATGKVDRYALKLWLESELRRLAA
jgi:5-methylcytosine-specific restriction endonuclease McrA